MDTLSAENTVLKHALQIEAKRNREKVDMIRQKNKRKRRQF